MMPRPQSRDTVAVAFTCTQVELIRQEPSGATHSSGKTPTVYSTGSDFLITLCLWGSPACWCQSGATDKVQVKKDRQATATILPLNPPFLPYVPSHVSSLNLTIFPLAHHLSDLCPFNMPHSISSHFLLLQLLSLLLLCLPTFSFLCSVTLTHVRQILRVIRQICPHTFLFWGFLELHSDVVLFIR